MKSPEFLTRYAQADAATRARLDAGVKFINHKIAQLRQRFLLIAFIALVACTVWWRSGTNFQWPLWVGIVVVVLAKTHTDRELARWYKRMVINRVVEAVGHGLTYSAKSDFERDRFKSMDLFQGRIDSFKSEDQIVGQKNTVSYALHEVHATRQEKQGKNSRTVTVFQGIIAVLEFNKHFHGHTVAVPDGESKWLGGLLGDVNARGGKRLVPMADADFEKQYSVYSTDDQEAHYLLTPRMIELIRGAQARFTGMRLCFAQNSLYVTLPSSRNRFEVSLFGEATPTAALNELAEVVAFAEQLIDVLDLETRIWSRA